MNSAVSVVVPTCGRPELLCRCLAALQEQDLQQPYEIIIVDDSTDSCTRQRLEKWEKVPGIAQRHLATAGGQGPAAARNRGWLAARSGVIAFTDDDCIPSSGWLRAGLSAINAGADAVTGPIEMPLAPRPTDYERDASGLTTAEFVTANCFCRRHILVAIGGFDEQFTAAWREDSDLQFRLLKHGARIVRSAQAIVTHPVRPARWGVSLSQQPKTQFNALLYKKHPRLYRERLAGFPRDYLLINGALATAIVAQITSLTVLAAIAAAVWTSVTGALCIRRLRRTSRAPRHIAEMIVTSILVPPWSLFWHVRGLWRYRTFFF